MMTTLRRVGFRLRALFRRERALDELSDEIRFHLENLTQEFQDQGLSPKEARAAALREFGHVDGLRLRCQENWRVRSIHAFVGDLRFGLRQLLKRPLFALVAISIVAVGIALAATASSIVDALVFRQIPAVDHSELYRVHSGVYGGVASAPDTRDLFERIEYPAFSYTQERNVEFDNGEGAQFVDIAELMGDAFGVLGWHALHGRLLNESDMLTGSQPAAVLSYDFWTNDLGGDSRLIGQSITLNGKTFQIAGVLPAEFDRVRRTFVPDVWIPFVHVFEDWKYDNRNSYAQRIILRLPKSVPVAELQGSLDQIEAYLRKTYPDESGKIDFEAVSEKEAAATESGDLVGKSYLIIGLVVSLLLIACFNVGNMLLANAYRRKREFAIRRSVGASSIHLTRQLIGESLILAIAGGALGSLLALFLVARSRDLLFQPRLDVVFDQNTFWVAFASVLLCGIVSGFIPAIHLSSSEVGSRLKEGAKGSSVNRSARALVVVQIAFSATLMTCAVLFYLSLKASLAYDSGFDGSRLAFFDLSLQGVDVERREIVAQNLRDEIAVVPGVESVGFTTLPPLDGYGRTQIRTDHFQPETAEDRNMTYFSFTSAGFLDALGVPLVEGRDVSDSEAVWPMQVALINESMQRRYWPDGNALGQEFQPWDETKVRVVGVFRDFSNRPWEEPRPLFLIPSSQGRVFMYVRAVGDPRSIRESVETVVRDPENEYVAGEVMLFKDAKKRVYGDTESALFVLGVLGAAALALSSVGIWYTTRQFVRQNRKENCIRLAVGASPKNLLWKVVKQSMALTVLGVVCGVTLSVVTARWAQSALQGVSYTQLTPYLVVAATFLAVGFVASYLPARNVLRVDPKEALNEVG